MLFVLHASIFMQPLYAMSCIFTWYLIFIHDMFMMIYFCGGLWYFALKLWWHDCLPCQLIMIHAAFMTIFVVHSYQWNGLLSRASRFDNMCMWFSVTFLGSLFRQSLARINLCTTLQCVLGATITGVCHMKCNKCVFASPVWLIQSIVQWLW